MPYFIVNLNNFVIKTKYDMQKVLFLWSLKWFIRSYMSIKMTLYSLNQLYLFTMSLLNSLSEFIDFFNI